MKNIIMILLKITGFVLLYLIVIIILPNAGHKIDELTGTTIHSNIYKKLDIFKSGTSNAIDGVGTNSKNRQADKINSLNEIQK